jgi:hypothetical protein
MQSKSRDIKIANRSFANVAQFKYLGTTITNQNWIHKGIKRILNWGKACYHLVQKPLSSRLLSKNGVDSILEILPKFFFCLKTSRCM